MCPSPWEADPGGLGELGLISCFSHSNRTLRQQEGFPGWRPWAHRRTFLSLCVLICTGAHAVVLGFRGALGQKAARPLFGPGYSARPGGLGRTQSEM